MDFYVNGKSLNTFSFVVTMRCQYYFIGYVQYFLQCTKLIYINMSLAYFNFCKSAAGDIAIMQLKLC